MAVRYLGGILFLGAIFAIVLVLILGTYRFLNRRRLSVENSARVRLTADEAGPSTAVIVKDEERASDLPFLNRFLAGHNLTPKLAAGLRRAGVTLTPGAFLLVVGVCAAVGGLLGNRLGMFGTAVGVIVGAVLPRVWLSWRRGRRVAQFDEQLPGAIDMLVSALRTGYSFHVATNFLGQELAAPLGPEFARIYEEQRLGIDPGTALVNMQERVGSAEIKMFVTALLIQRKTGGNLSEVLSNTADVMRERIDVRGQLDTLTAEAKWSGRLLALLPVIVFFGLLFIAPQFMHTLLDTSIGHLMMAGAASSVILGYFVMMRIARVDF